MPFNCPLSILDYNACYDCYKRYNDECWAYSNLPRKLADILTSEERISILEDALHSIKPEWDKKQWDYVQQLSAEIRGWRQKHAEMMLSLDKLNKKKKKRWE